MSPEDNNAKEMKRLEDIANEEESETLERLVSQNKVDRQTILNYRSALETSRQYKESSALHKFKVVLQMLILRIRAKNMQTHHR